MQIGSLVERIREFNEEGLARIASFGIPVPPLYTPVVISGWEIDYELQNSYWLTIEGYEKDAYGHDVYFENYMFRELQPPMAKELQDLLKESFSIPRRFPEYV